MQKIGASTDTADVNGEFTEGSAAQGVYATLLRAEWLNTIQRELVAVVERSGLVLDADKDDQVFTAIQTIIRNASTTFAIDGGTENAYVVSYTPTLTAFTNGMSVRFQVKTTNTGASSLTVNGIGPKPLMGGAQQALQGGEVVAAGIADVIYSIALDAWILRSCTGGNPQVPTATKALHALNLQQAQSLISAARGAVYVSASALIIPGFYNVDTTPAQAIVLTLPPNPAKGDSFTFTDPNNNWGARSWRLARNGKSIHGKAEDWDLGVGDLQISLWYNGTEWRFF